MLGRNMQWNFQNKGTRTSPAQLSLVLKKGLFSRDSGRSEIENSQTSFDQNTADA